MGHLSTAHNAPVWRVIWLSQPRDPFFCSLATSIPKVKWKGWIVEGWRYWVNIGDPKFAITPSAIYKRMRAYISQSVGTFLSQHPFQKLDRMVE